MTTEQRSPAAAAAEAAAARAAKGGPGPVPGPGTGPGHRKTARPSLKQATIDGLRSRSGSMKRPNDDASNERADKCGRYAANDPEENDGSGGE